MNIFYLDEDIEKCATYHVNKHIVKMPSETALLLCGAHHATQSNLAIPYKKTHINHPSSVWTRASKKNYIYLCNLGLSLCDEYTYRYGKIHACKKIIQWALDNIPNLPDSLFTPPTPAMDDSDKIKINGSINSLLSYRNYYKIKKVHLHDWKNRNKPEWI